MQSIAVEFPCDPEPLDSPYYITRPPVEELTCKEITRAGSVIRIQAPRKMGKTSLVLRLMNHAESCGYRTVYLDFQQAEESICTSLDRFLRWFCVNVSRQLNIKLRLDEIWDEDIGSKVNATIFFQGYLLENIENPLVLVLNEVNRIFEYPTIASEFLSLLRFWHEQAKQNEIFEKLRLVVVHSTEVYISFNINQSPFNVGLPIKLPELDVEQIQDLAQRHGINWMDEQGRENTILLKAMVGGHPYLIRLALYHLVNNPQKTLESLLQEAPTITSIYTAHLRSHLVNLLKSPALVTAFKKVISSLESVELDHILAYKLESMGLVKLQGNKCGISCDLYRLYFTAQNLEEQNWREQVEELQRQNQELQRISNTDDLTQLANKRHFDIYLKQKWQSLAINMTPLSLILCDIDYFKIYNSTRGKQAGNECLQRVANRIRSCCNIPDNLVARYAGDEFAIILPNINTRDAFNIAETIRQEVKNLGIFHDNTIDGLPDIVITISLGIASVLPQTDESVENLVSAAEKALLKSTRQGRDCTYISSTLNYGLDDG